MPNSGLEELVISGTDDLVDTSIIQLYLQSLLECDQCGNCCQIYDDVTIDEEHDLENMAELLDISTEEFKSKYLADARSTTHTNPIYNNFLHTIHGMNDTAYRFKDQPCAFLDRNTLGCKIYSARPFTCRGYPFMTMVHDIDDENKTWIIKPFNNCPASTTCIFKAGPQFERVEEEVLPNYRMPPHEALMSVRAVAIQLRRMFLYKTNQSEGLTDERFYEEIAKCATVAYLCLRLKGWRIKFLIP